MGLTMETLDEIAIRNGTDKATVFTRTYAKPHGYTPHFDLLFSPLREQPIKLLEIGVGGGESIRTWLEYFPLASVVGVDNNPDSWNGPHDRYRFVLGNQGDGSFWEKFTGEVGSGWDVIIDDGSHVSLDILTTWNSLWPRVNPGGFYAIEDLGVGYGAGSVFLREGYPTHMEFIKSLLDQINLLDEIQSLHFSRELAVFRKYPITHV